MKQKSSGMWHTPKSMGDICTSSLLRVWWLSTFRGYRIRSSTQMPRAGRFGRMRYYTRWILAPKE